MKWEIKKIVCGVHLDGVDNQRNDATLHVDGEQKLLKFRKAIDQRLILGSEVFGQCRIHDEGASRLTADINAISRFYLNVEQLTWRCWWWRAFAGWVKTWRTANPFVNFLSVQVRILAEKKKGTYPDS